MTENGDVGASAIRTRAPGDGSWKRSIASSQTQRGSRRGPRRGCPAAARRRTPPRSIAAAARVEAQADLPRRLDLDGEEVAAAAREDVVVVGRRRAARRREGREPAARRRRDRVRVDVRPHGIQGDEPLEERPVGHEPARGRLVQVVVAVDEAGRHQTARPVDAPRDLQLGRRGPLPDRDDPVAVHDEMPVERARGAPRRRWRWRRARWRSSRCLQDRRDDPLVAGAAAEVPGQALADVLLARLGHAAQQVAGRDEQARGAEPALHGTRLEERRLERVQRPVRAGHAGDGVDAAAVCLRGEHEARARDLPVDRHGAGAALALLAGVLRSASARGPRAGRAAGCARRRRRAAGARRRRRSAPCPLQPRAGVRTVVRCAGIGAAARRG